MKYYIHELPGRLRIKIPTLKKNQRLAMKIDDLLFDLIGVNDINVNTVTGSIVVNYDPETIKSEAILGALAENGHINIKELLESRNERADVYQMVGEAASRAIFGFAIEKAFAGSPYLLLTALV